MLSPLSWIAVTALSVSVCTVPDAVMLVAPLIAPVFVMPPLLLLIPPVIAAPLTPTVKPFAAVIVPVPVVVIFPLVDRFPFSLIESVAAPLD